MLYDRTNIESIENYAKELIGKTFNEIIKCFLENQSDYEIAELNYGNPKRKGGLGNLLEEVYFKYKANSDSRPDFHEVGLELKVSPYQLTKKNEYRAGERLVLTMIDYNSPVEKKFFSSHLWQKMEKILLIFYFRNPEILNNLDYRIDYTNLFSPPEEDLKIIIDDYNKIIQKIENGNAHELSESDTVYLSACTKGSSAEKSFVHQYYNSHVQAKKRAFALKQSYMHFVLQNIVNKSHLKTENIVTNKIELVNIDFESFILSKFKNYYGKTDKDLCCIFNREYNNNKSQWSDLIYKILGIKSNHASEFSKANIVVKSIRLEENGKIKENMSFPTFKFKEIILEEWETSKIFKYFDETKFLFVIYKKTGNEYILYNAKFWNMPMKDLESDVYDCWIKTINIIKNGVNLEKIGNIIINNLPSIRENRIMHVRPHATKSAYMLKDGTIIGNIDRDANELPDGQWMTNQCFWLNNSYILNEIFK